MVKYKKPPFIKPLVYIKLPIVAVLILTYVLLMVFAFYNAHRYTSAITLQIEARIIKVEYVSSEAADSYDAIMQYVHNGVTYEAVYKSFSRKTDAEALIGQSVTAVVDAGNPADTLEKLQSSAISLLGLAGYIMFFLIFAPSVPHRQRYVQTYGWCLESIKKDFWHLPQYGMCYLLFWVVGCIILYLRYSDVLLRHIPLGLIVGEFIVLAIIGFISTIRFIRDYCLIMAGRISFQQNHYHSKNTQNDGDGTDFYYVNFTDGKTIWEKNVSKAVYDKIKDGDTVESAYLGKQKKPILSIYRNEDVL